MIDDHHPRLHHLTSRVCHDNPGWWQAAGASGAGPDDELVATALAAALLADRGEAGAYAEVGRLPLHGIKASLRQRLEEALAGAPVVRDLAGRVRGPCQALGVYLAARSVIDGSRPPGRVFLEDLSEALLMPPVLVRQLDAAADAFGLSDGMCR